MTLRRDETRNAILFGSLWMSLTPHLATKPPHYSEPSTARGTMKRGCLQSREATVSIRPEDALRNPRWRGALLRYRELRVASDPNNGIEQTRGRSGIRPRVERSRSVPAVAIGIDDGVQKTLKGGFGHPGRVMVIRNDDVTNVDVLQVHV